MKRPPVGIFNSGALEDRLSKTKTNESSSSSDLLGAAMFRRISRLFGLDNKRARFDSTSGKTCHSVCSLIFRNILFEISDVCLKLDPG